MNFILIKRIIFGLFALLLSIPTIIGLVTPTTECSIIITTISSIYMLLLQGYTIVFTFVSLRKGNIEPSIGLFVANLIMCGLFATMSFIVARDLCPKEDFSDIFPLAFGCQTSISLIWLFSAYWELHTR